jgi:hypothetical protein
MLQYHYVIRRLEIGEFEEAVNGFGEDGYQLMFMEMNEDNELLCILEKTHYVESE